MHRPYWVTCYIISSPSNLRLIFYGYSIHFILHPSTIPYHNLSLPPIPLSQSLPPSMLLRALFLSLGCLERAAPTISVRVALLASAPPPGTIP